MRFTDSPYYRLLPAIANSVSVLDNTTIAGIRRTWERSGVRGYLRHAILRSLAGFSRIKPHGVSHLTLHAMPENQAELFAAFLDRLSDHGDIVSASDGIERMRAGRPDPAFTISFDDGFKSTFTVGGQILRERNLPATIFVSSGFVGLAGAALERFTRERLQWHETREPMSAADLAKCADFGIEIGSHGVSHRSFAAMSAEDARAELTDSKAALEGMTGKQVRFFAWPFGTYEDFPEPFISAALSAGYQALFSGVTSSDRPDSKFVYQRRTIELSWGLPVCTYLALRG